RPDRGACASDRGVLEPPAAAVGLLAQRLHLGEHQAGAGRGAARQQLGDVSRLLPSRAELGMSSSAAAAIAIGAGVLALAGLALAAFAWGRVRGIRSAQQSLLGRDSADL